MIRQISTTLSLLKSEICSFLCIRSKGVLLCGSFVIYVLCLSCFHICSLLPCGHLPGKGWPLVCDDYCVFVTFPCGILGQVCNLIVSFPDLCHLAYFIY